MYENIINNNKYICIINIFPVEIVIAKILLNISLLTYIFNNVSGRVCVKRNSKIAVMQKHWDPIGYRYSCNSCRLKDKPLSIWTQSHFTPFIENHGNRYYVLTVKYRDAIFIKDSIYKAFQAHSQIQTRCCCSIIWDSQFIFKPQLLWNVLCDFDGWLILLHMILIF